MDSTSPVTVVKLGGSVLNSKDTATQDIVYLSTSGVLLVVVHGGASAVTSWLGRLNHSTRFIDGERVTDEVSMEVVTAVLAGLVNKEIVAAIMERGGRAIGISGADDGLIQARVKCPEAGFLGEVMAINPAPIHIILEKGIVPVVAPVSLHATSHRAGLPRLLNVNGDVAAGEIAAALKAQRLIFLTDVDGIKDSSGSLIPALSAVEARELLNSGVTSGGMVPKLKACLRALEGGVGMCLVVNGNRPHALLGALDYGGGGTMVTTYRDQ